MFAASGYLLGYVLHMAHQAEHLPYEEEEWKTSSELVLRLQKAFPTR